MTEIPRKKWDFVLVLNRFFASIVSSRGLHRFLFKCFVKHWFPDVYASKNAQNCYKYYLSCGQPPRLSNSNAHIINDNLTISIVNYSFLFLLQLFNILYPSVGSSIILAHYSQKHILDIFYRLAFHHLFITIVERGHQRVYKRTLSKTLYYQSKITILYYTILFEPKSVLWDFLWQVSQSTFNSESKCSTYFLLLKF